MLARTTVSFCGKIAWIIGTARILIPTALGIRINMMTFVPWAICFLTSAVSLNSHADEILGIEAVDIAEARATGTFCKIIYSPP